METRNPPDCNVRYDYRRMNFPGPIDATLFLNIGVITDTAPRTLVGPDSSMMGFNYVLRGTGTYFPGKGPVQPLHPGVFFHIDHTQKFRLEHYGSDFVECYITVNRTIVDALNFLDIIPSTSWCRDIGIQPAIVGSYAALQRDLTNPDVDNAALLRNLLTHLSLIYAAKARLSKRDAIVQKACIALGNKLHKPLNTLSLTRQLGVSPRNFVRMFRDVTGMSPMAYRIQRRIEAAGHLLLTKSPKQVATELGYKDVFFFYKQFKAHTGMTTSSYCHQYRLNTENICLGAKPEIYAFAGAQ